MEDKMMFRLNFLNIVLHADMHFVLEITKVDVI